MTSITKYKAQWEREAVEAERKLIVEWLNGLSFACEGVAAVSLAHAADQIERGEYKSEVNNAINT